MHHHHRSYFFWDTNVGEYLFSGLNINGLGGLLLLSLILIFMTIVFEGVKVLQTKANARTARELLRNSTLPSPSSATTTNLISSSSASTHQEQQQRLSNKKKMLPILGQAFIFLFHNTLGYILMLSVMVYNGYVFLVVVFGLGLGYFLFGHVSMRINMENIRARTTNAMCVKTCPTEPSLPEPSMSASTGYVNEMISSSSTSSTISEHYNNSNYTQTSLLDKDDNDYNQCNYESQDDSNVIQSCRL